MLVVLHQLEKGFLFFLFFLIGLLKFANTFFELFSGVGELFDLFEQFCFLLVVQGLQFFFLLCSFFLFFSDLFCVFFGEVFAVLFFELEDGGFDDVFEAFVFAQTVYLCFGEG